VSEPLEDVDPYYYVKRNVSINCYHWSYILLRLYSATWNVIEIRLKEN
jgi:hypothetical protein